MNNVLKVPITNITPDPNQPRKIFSESYIAGLAKSLKIEGMINPIEVDSNYMIITGECRWKAATLAGWTEIPVIINDNKLPSYERLRRQMAENLHQSTAGNGVAMNAIDVASGYKRMLEMRGYHLSGADRSSGIDQGISELARDLGISHNKISTDLDLLEEPEEIIKSIQKGTPKTFYTEMKEIPEKYKEGLREAIKEGKITNSKVIRQFRQLAKQAPDKAEIAFLHHTQKQSEDANRILNRAIDLAVALRGANFDNFSDQDKNMVHGELNSVTGTIRNFLGRLTQSSVKPR